MPTRTFAPVAAQPAESGPLPSGSPIAEPPRRVTHSRAAPRPPHAPARPPTHWHRDRAASAPAWRIVRARPRCRLVPRAVSVQTKQAPRTNRRLGPPNRAHFERPHGLCRRAVRTTAVCILHTAHRRTRRGGLCRRSVCSTASLQRRGPSREYMSMYKQENIDKMII